MEKLSWQTSEIAGSEVCDIHGERLGVLHDVLPTGGNDIWVVVPDKGSPYRGEILIPALVSIVKHVDAAAKKITVDLPPGIRELNAEPKPEYDIDE